MRNFIHLSLALLLAPLSVSAASMQDEWKLARINHIVVFYLENHSFDNVFGTFPGADGFAQAGKKTIQVDSNGKPYETLPQVTNNGRADSRFPADLANRPFLISQYVPDDKNTGDLVHRFYQLQQQMDKGKMDKFVSEGDSGGLPMGYYENKDSPLWQYAKKYTLADHFFTGAFGGSFLNHMWLVCACAPRYDNAPQEMRAVLDKQGRLVDDGSLTPDGYAVNTIQPQGWPYDRRVPDREKRLPPQDMPTIGDRLSEKNIDWAWYGGGWRAADEGVPAPSFEYHHQPFSYFAEYAHGTDARREHIKDENDFISAIQSNSLPSVSFYKPIGEFDLHPGYSNLKSGEDHAFDLIGKIEHSNMWKDTVIIVTFDDAGGFYDHVMPPKGDRFGPGERVSALIISPFAKHGYIDHTSYDTTSILSLIEHRFHLKPLGTRDAKAKDLVNSLE